MIKLINVCKKFDHRWITKGVTLTIPPEKMTVIIGKSGEGKSVLLKQMIGLIKPTSGSILIDDIDITQLKEKELNAIFEKVGYVFQFAALLDSLTVFENVALPLIENGYPEKAALPIVKERLSLVNLKADILNKYPSELSGGMLKRVGLARTLIHNPKIILYDEPVTGLDPITARVVHELMDETQKRLKITSVVVSHNVESFKYADYVALLKDGTIKYFGDAHTIWEEMNPDIYNFIRGIE
ncbi:TPA: ABC transporter ATP-binding protein [Candidatus Dependentiae bacterium]|nr:MAG: ABC transporter related protein [candidate division TM6 bacterium GW2011_GWF2_36_131]KKQ03598.1 MAG: ABC transporter related protein [candidate division TM6 bacterium GW2011_GWE2_36_25]KKQ20125.1 MAG: ABC transporter related protein [candidate division TM6 bacterium GW2011_GWA2_36_9]HBR70668.1 ABC transporter ATP-binding protein [Candidatus Dependentiae bacterium]HCU00288.1 ABC transporter ATP-binding protein [Candidatus Dependentiae bacterium]